MSPEVFAIKLELKATGVFAIMGLFSTVVFAKINCKQRRKHAYKTPAKLAWGRVIKSIHKVTGGTPIKCNI